MQQYDRIVIALAFCLSCLAGYVDALGFIAFGGFFVSFMTGNSTRLGIELSGGHLRGIALAGGIILVFVLGVVLGSLVSQKAGRFRRPAVLGLVTLCLALSGVMDMTFGGLVGSFVLAVAMGAENAVFQRDGEVTIGLTYMTGTLVKMGQRMAAALTGGPRLGWLRHFLLWLSLSVGALLGGLSYAWFDGAAIWFAVAASACLTLVAARLRWD